MDRNINARRGPPVLPIGMFALMALCLMLASCSGTPQSSMTSTRTLPAAQVAATLTPTPTRVIAAVEATPTTATTPTSAPNVWQETIHSSTTGNYGTAGTCTGETWDMQFQVQVASDGKVTGKGSGQLGSNPTCSGPGFLHSDYLSRQAKSLEFSVRGTRTDLAFKLQLTETKIDGATAGLINYALLVSLTNNPPVLTVPITSPRTAEGETDVNVAVPDSAGGTAVAQHKVTMTCSTCK
jgi:hypothetical protein